MYVYGACVFAFARVCMQTHTNTGKKTCVFDSLLFMPFNPSMGVVLTASGTLPSTVAGLASSLVTRAQSLSSEEGDIPAAVIETAEGRCADSHSPLCPSHPLYAPLGCALPPHTLCGACARVFVPAVTDMLVTNECRLLCVWLFVALHCCHYENGKRVYFVPSMYVLGCLKNLCVHIQQICKFFAVRAF